ncbi:MAG: AsmA-like C-terminal domain-containing protein [Beijerinckiaceae bacterium]
MPADASSEIAMPARRSRRVWKLAGFFLLVLVLSPVAAAGWLALALRDDQVSLDPFRERFEGLIAERVGGGVRAAIGGVALQRDEKGLRLHVKNMVLRDRADREIVSSPDAILTFDPVQLLTLDMRPSRVVLNGLSLTARAVPVPTGEQMEWQDALKARIRAFSRAVRDNRNSDWSALAFENATLTLETGSLPGVVNVSNWRMTASGGRGAPIRVDGEALINGARARYRIETAISDTGMTVSLRIDDIIAPLAAPFLAHLSKEASFRAPSTINASFALDEGGVPLEGSFALSLRDGALASGVPQIQPLSFQSIDLAAKWLGTEGQIEDVSWTFVGEGNQLGGKGKLLAPEPENPTWRYTSASNNWLVAGATAADKPVIATQVTIPISLAQDFSELRITDLSVKGPETAFAGDARMMFQSDGLHLMLGLAAREMPGRTLLAWWPTPVVTPARDFFLKNLVEGTLDSLDISLDLPPREFRAALAMEALPRDSFRLTGRYSHAVMRVIDGLPPLRGLGGTAKVDAKSGEGAVASGFLELAAGRRIGFSEGVFSLAALDTTRPSAKFDFRAAAPLDNILDLLSKPQMRDAFSLKIPVGEAKGAFSGRIGITMPLADKLGPRDIVTTVDAALTGVTLDKAFGQDKLENATLRLTGDSSGVDVKGDGRWQGTPVTIEFEKDSTDGSTTAVLGLTMDEAGLKKRGIDLGGAIRGPIPIIIRASTGAAGPDGKDGERRAKIEADLTRATIRQLAPGLQKPAGRPAKLSFEAIERGRAFTLQNIAFDSGPTSVRGEALIEAERGLRSARFSLLRLSPGDNVRVEIDRTGPVAKVTIRGNNFDARPFLKPDTDREGASEPDIEIDLKTTLLSGFNGEVLTSPDLKLSRRAGQPRLIQLTARLGGQPLSIQGATPRQNSLPVTIEAGDAGAFYRFLDIYSRMQGGDVVGEVTLGASRVSGVLLSRNFELRNEPAIRRLIAADQRVEGELAVANTARFTKMRLEFQKDNNLLTLREAVIFGPQIGLNFNGTIDQARDRISMSGTFIPAYGLNNVFSQIPLVGGILGGGRNEGLLGITFSATGQLSKPTIAVNPLSAVAPGIFRKIFEFRNDATQLPTIMPEEPSNR